MPASLPRSGLTDEDRSSIIEEYTAATPSLETSQAITKQIADARGLKVASVRAILVKAGVYIAQPKPRTEIDPKDRQRLISLYHATPDHLRDDTVWQGEFAKKHNYQWYPISQLFAGLRFERENPPPPPSKYQPGYSTGSGFFGSPKPHYNFKQRLDGEAGWFSNPLWPINTMVVLFLLALVIVAIGSVFE